MKYKPFFIRIFMLLPFLFILTALQAQDTITVNLKTNVKKDKIQLRWAVNSPAAWYYTNKNGITIERYTLMRNGEALDTPEKITLVTGLKPHPLNDWETLAQKDNYAAIIAQALYGQDFEVSGGKKDISYMIALSQEQEQRYAMSMLAAEASYQAALFAGWGYDDKTVKEGERYLYRVIPVSPDVKKIIETGSAYTGLEDYSPLPRPLELDAIWGNQSVMVTWNSKLLEQYYASYYLERSDDGLTFKRRSAMPLTNVMGNDRMFFTDSISNNKTYYYRVSGLTSFGEEGPLSDTIQGKGIPRLIYNPSIIKAIPDDDGKVEVSWNFDERGNNELSSFELRRGNTDKGPFSAIVSDISPTSRTAIYEKPLPENYLVIAAIPKEGEDVVSFPYMLLMEDSIPPAVPQGLEGIVDTTGIVHLKWTANTDADLLGYRIYRGQTQGEELIPLTNDAVKINEFRDSINIYNLNSKVYYAVTSLDKRYNQSALSETLELEKPDLTKPSPPFITKCEATDRGVLLEWVSGKEILRSHIIFRTEAETKDKVVVKTLTNPQIKTYLDSTVVGGTTYIYEIVSENKSFIESDPSPALSVKAKEKEVRLEIKRFKGDRTKEGIILKWEYLIPDVRSVSIYRKEGESPLSLWKEADFLEREILDTTVKQNTPYEYLLVIKNRKGIPVSVQIKID